MGENSAETASSSSQPSSSSPPQKSTEEVFKQSQIPAFYNFPAVPDGYYQMYPVMYPVPVPGFVPPQNEEHRNRGAGIYAVPVNPYMGHVTGIPYNTLIPLTYNTPTRPTSEASTNAENQGQAAQQQHQQQQPAPQRQVVVRRFQIAFQIDLFLMLKLAAVIFLFNQDGSRQRLIVLVLFASIVYLYQTGALTPIVRWLSQGMQRAAAPPHPPRPAARAENVPAARQGVDNAVPAEVQPQGGMVNQNQPAANEADRVVENENVAQPEVGNGGNQWWGIVKEVQMIVFGFITSLLPGFHNHMD
ncbi:uncharacterized protein LOC114731188 [Neltuma alba]|uniref:uncharacterized protein LOC114731188 n=1 Tax=Neltuma alba TaxID=207710 RepID=UPI0010A2C58C|nr:uncharacterized protein LOC114731188 [Prosopis alba]